MKIQIVGQKKNKKNQKTLTSRQASIYQKSYPYNRVTILDTNESILDCADI